MPAEAAGYSARAGWRSAFQFHERRFRQTGLRQVADAVEDTAKGALELGAWRGFGGALLCLALIRRPEDERPVRRPAHEPAPLQRPEARERFAPPPAGPAIGASPLAAAAPAAPVRASASSLPRSNSAHPTKPEPAGQTDAGTGSGTDDAAASAWAGRGAGALGLEGPVDPDTFKAVLEGEVPDGSGRRLGRRMGDGGIRHRPGRDLTFSAPKSVSLAALVGGDARIVEAHDRAAMRALDWFEKNAAETCMQDKSTGRMVRAGNQQTVIATFTHDTSRNLDPALHTHSVIANMLLGPDNKWRTMANKSLYASKMLLGALYRNELAGELARLGYGIERTHAEGRFEIAGVSRET